jgi:hypothetical protein
MQTLVFSITDNTLIEWKRNKHNSHMFVKSINGYDVEKKEFAIYYKGAQIKLSPPACFEIVKEKIPQYKGGNIIIAF